MKTFKNAFATLALLAVAALSVQANAATRYKTDEIVSEEGGAVAFPAGITLPSSVVGDDYVTTYSATLAAGTNVAAVVTPVTLKTGRRGNWQCAWGQVSIDPTSGATASTFTLTLPVARSANFSGTGGATGFAGIGGGEVGACLATNGAKTVTCNYKSGGTAVELVPVQFCALVTGD